MDALSWKTLALVFCTLVLVQEVTSVETNAGCIERSLVEKNPLNIPDSSFTASSHLYDKQRTFDKRYVPSNARLNGNWGWSPRNNNDPNDYLQIDLGAVRVITAVATQANGGNNAKLLSEWITEYKLMFKKNMKSDWLEYENIIRIEKLFIGTITSDTVVRYDFTNPQTARYIRFIPVSYEKSKTMRVNVYVMEQEPPRVTATPSETFILLNWTITPCINFTGFIVNVTKKGEFNVGRATSYNITGLQPYTDYEIRVKTVEYELWNQTMTIKTTIAVPEVPPIIISNVTNSSASIVLQWKLEKPHLLHGPLTGYRIIYTAQGVSTKTIDVGVVNTWTLTSLEKYTWYTITVSVKNTKYVGPPSRALKIRTMGEAPSSQETVSSSLIPPQSSVGPRLEITWDKPRDKNAPWAAPTNVSVTMLNSTSIHVSWRPIPDDKINSNITSYEVNLTLYETRCNDELLINRSNIVHIPGRNTHVVMQGLLLCSVYGISVRGYTMSGPGPYSDTVYLTTQDRASAGVERTTFLTRSFIVGIVVAFLALIALTVGLIVMILKCRIQVRNKDIAMPSSDVYTASSHRGDTNLPHFDGYKDNVSNSLKKAEIIPYFHAINFLTPNGRVDECVLIEEFQNIPATLRYQCTHAAKSSNKKKNRYINIVAYDHSRVILKDHPDCADYINASFLCGYDGSPKVYIATQGPLPDTVKDFWQMVWQQNTATVVMLTNLVELRKTKCHQYWPERSEQYGDIMVTNHQTQVFADYVIRTFLLAKTNRTIRQVHHFHFTAWPDCGVPQHTTAILVFRRKVRKETPVDAGPTVIHCSAGVGRTGAYVMIDAMLEQAKHQQSLDIFSYLQTIREDRPFLVQTEDQYKFVHLAVYEALSCGNTEIEAHNLTTALKNLSTVDKQKNKTGFALEFQRITALTQNTEEEQENCKVGMKQENFHKNRYSDTATVDERRVILIVNDEDEGDYINASFVDTYRDRNAFIVTQAPLENTVADFWRMVMDYDIGTIVMLNNLQEGDEIFPQYWPEQETLACGGIIVNLVSAEYHDEVVTRVVEVIDSVKCLSVLHLQHTRWANKYIPPNSQSVLSLLNEVDKSQRKVNGSSPVLVQCSDGVGRSGTFCAIASTLERVKQEQVLDVFQTVKSIRGNRPGAVQTLTQYVFCYQIVQKYLDSFSDYANFNG